MQIVESKTLDGNLILQAVFVIVGDVTEVNLGVGMASFAPVFVFGSFQVDTKHLIILDIITLPHPANNVPKFSNRFGI